MPAAAWPRGFLAADWQTRFWWWDATSQPGQKVHCAAMRATLLPAGLLRIFRDQRVLRSGLLSDLWSAWVLGHPASAAPKLFCFPSISWGSVAACLSRGLSDYSRISSLACLWERGVVRIWVLGWHSCWFRRVRSRLWGSRSRSTVLGASVWPLTRSLPMGRHLFLAALTWSFRSCVSHPCWSECGDRSGLCRRDSLRCLWSEAHCIRASRDDPDQALSEVGSWPLYQWAKPLQPINMTKTPPEELTLRVLIGNVVLAVVLVVLHD